MMSMFPMHFGDNTRILEKVEKNAKIVGMGYLSTYPDGSIIGSAFPDNEMVETQFNIYNKYKVTGDKGLMF